LESFSTQLSSGRRGSDRIATAGRHAPFRGGGGEAAAAASAGALAPTRAAFLYFPNGVWTDSWIPKTAGADYELPFSLSPLQGLKSEFSILSGSTKAASHGGDGHYCRQPTC